MAWNRFLVVRFLGNDRQVAEEPTSETPLTFGWPSALAAFGSPLTRLNAPGGKPMVDGLGDPLHGERHLFGGFHQDGVARGRRVGENQNGTIAGKLNGAIIPNTPMGRRRTSPSIPWSPDELIALLQDRHAAGHLAVLDARFISARASVSDLPISSVNVRAIFSSFPHDRDQLVEGLNPARHGSFAPALESLAATAIAPLTGLGGERDFRQHFTLLGFSTSIRPLFSTSTHLPPT